MQRFVTTCTCHEVSMEDHDSTSTGLMIGIIVGGALVVLAIVAMLFGALFWVRTEHRAAPAVAVVAKGPPVVGVPAPAIEGPAGEAPAGEAPVPAPGNPKLHPRLIGVWDAQTRDGTQATLDFRGDGTLYATAKGLKQAAESKTTERWQVAEHGAALKLTRTTGKGAAIVQDVRFLDDDLFFLDGPGGGANYKRR
jgi:hypothetical protein